MLNGPATDSQYHMIYFYFLYQHCGDIVTSLGLQSTTGFCSDIFVAISGMIHLNHLQIFTMGLFFFLQKILSLTILAWMKTISFFAPTSWERWTKFEIVILIREFSQTLPLQTPRIIGLDRNIVSSRHNFRRLLWKNQNIFFKHDGPMK